MFLSTSGTLRNRISPAIPSAFSSVFFPFQSVPAGRIYTKNQAVPFKIEAFPGEIIPCTGQERGAFQGDFRVKTGDFPPKNSSERGTTGAWFEGCLGVLFARGIPPKREKKGA